jgi:aarF domain-containing kinase
LSLSVTLLPQIFDDNFIHGDLHPGNLLLVPNELGELSSRRPRFRVMDYGLTAELTKADRQNLILVFKAVIDRNGREVGRLMIEKSRIQQQVIDPEGFETGMQQVGSPPLLTSLDRSVRSSSSLDRLWTMH